MGNKLHNFDWDQILSMESADSQMEAFQNNLFSFFSESFPMKTKIVFNESQEFYTDKLVVLKRKKKSEFKKHRRSEKYLSLHQIYKTELRKAIERKFVFLEPQVLECGTELSGKSCVVMIRMRTLR